MTAGQAFYLRRELGGQLEGYETTRAIARISLACVLLAGVTYVVYLALDTLLGRSLPGQVISVGAALSAGVAIYTRAVLRMQVEEAEQIRDAVMVRVRAAGSGA